MLKNTNNLKRMLIIGAVLSLLVIISGIAITTAKE